MNVFECQQTLGSIESQNPAVNDELDAVHQYTELVKAGKLSPQEYAELLKDIQRVLDINKAEIEQEHLNTINTCINGLITLAGAA
jgi:polyhydroxyalkanoate synthesis regulator phasin